MPEVEYRKFFRIKSMHSELEDPKDLTGEIELVWYPGGLGFSVLHR
jgi:hypothetical protein